MDVNTLLAASSIGRQQEYEEQIIKEVWADDTHSNMAEDKAGDACEAAYEAQGAEAYNKCRAALISCQSDSNCDAIGIKYAAYLEKGGNKTFEQFKKTSATLSQLGQISTGILGGLLDKVRGTGVRGENGFAVGGYYEPPNKRKYGLYIGLGLLVVVGIGTAIYFGTRKK